MPKTLPEKFFPKLKRVAQINSYFCGPAVLEMLCSNLDFEISQDKFSEVLGGGKKVKEHGMTVEEMALAVSQLAPALQFWFKRNSTVKELTEVLNVYKYPVGVEWQGIFDYEDADSDDEDDDPGHYSVIVGINKTKKLVTIIDPDKHYIAKNRKIGLLRFERRWWDINKVLDAKTGKRKESDDYRMMFLITPKGVTFPEKYGMNRG